MLHLDPNSSAFRSNRRVATGHIWFTGHLLTNPKLKEHFIKEQPLYSNKHKWPEYKWFYILELRAGFVFWYPFYFTRKNVAISLRNFVLNIRKNSRDGKICWTGSYAADLLLSKNQYGEVHANNKRNCCLVSQTMAEERLNSIKIRESTNNIFSTKLIYCQWEASNDLWDWSPLYTEQSVTA